MKTNEVQFESYEAKGAHRAKANMGIYTMSKRKQALRSLSANECPVGIKIYRGNPCCVRQI